MSAVEQYEAPKIPYEDLIRLRLHIEAALEYSGQTPTHTFMNIVEGIESGRFRAWCGKDAIAICEPMTYPLKRGVHIFLAGGNLEELIEIQDEIAVWAKAAGADHLSLCGRKGWERALKDHGWGRPMTALTRELKDG